MEEILASIRRIIADDPARMARHENEGRREGQSASVPPAQVNAGVPKESRPATKPLASPLRAFEGQANERALPPVPEVASIGQEPEDDILAAEEEQAGEQVYEEVDAEEQHEEPAEQIQEILTSPPVHREQEPRRQPASAVHYPSRDENEHRLMSADTSRAVDTAFNTLAQTVFVQNGPTLEELVKQMLRPMLKAWIDDNLPKLVERLVRAEIERVSRGR
jgi:cell pole-organizing protein PopZ